METWGSSERGAALEEGKGSEEEEEGGRRGWGEVLTT